MGGKMLLKGVFNLYGQVHILYAHTTERNAWNLFTRRLAKITGVSCYKIRLEFNGEKDNYTILKG